MTARHLVDWVQSSGRPLPFALMVTLPTVVFMVVVPVASLLTALMVVAPIIARPAAIVSCVMPFPFAPVVFFPLPTLPITTPVIVPVTIPARTNDNSGRRLDTLNVAGLRADALYVAPGVD